MQMNSKRQKLNESNLHNDVLEELASHLNTLFERKEPNLTVFKYVLIVKVLLEQKKDLLSTKVPETYLKMLCTTFTTVTVGRPDRSHHDSLLV